MYSLNLCHNKINVRTIIPAYLTGLDLNIDPGIKLLIYVLFFLNFSILKSFYFFILIYFVVCLIINSCIFLVLFCFICVYDKRVDLIKIICILKLIHCKKCHTWLNLFIMDFNKKKQRKMFDQPRRAINQWF